jgi:hypothetical protein
MTAINITTIKYLPMTRNLLLFRLIQLQPPLILWEFSGNPFPDVPQSPGVVENYLPGNAWDLHHCKVKASLPSSLPMAGNVLIIIRTVFPVTGTGHAAGHGITGLPLLVPPGPPACLPVNLSLALPTPVEVPSF